MGFVYYCLYNFLFDYKLYKKGFVMSFVSKILINYSNKRENLLKKKKFNLKCYIFKINYKHSVVRKDIYYDKK